MFSSHYLFGYASSFCHSCLLVFLEKVSIIGGVMKKTLKEATKIVRDMGFEVGLCSGGTRRITCWDYKATENCKIMWDIYLSKEEFKYWAYDLRDIWG
jgi:hypothetical protein